jgi:outer membrane receptor for ferrienterochelin and colicins
MSLTIRCLPLLLLLTLGLVHPSAASAQEGAPSDPPPDPPKLADHSLEDLLSVEVGTVFGAAKREQRVTEAPSSVTILTAEDVRRFGWRTMGEALASVRGFYTTYDRNYTYVGVRGFGRPSDYNNRVLVLINGHRYNDNVYDQALVGNDFPIDLALVERIEIIRGPGSALYGTSAFFAVINVVVRPGGAIGGSESTIEVGSLHSYRARSSYGYRTVAGTDALLSVTRTGSHGRHLLYFPEYDGDPATNFGLSADADAESSTSLFGSVSRGRLAVHGLFSTRRKELPTGAYATTLGDARNHTDDTRAWIDATVTGAWKGAAVTARGFADYSGYRGRYIYLDGLLDNRDTGDGAWVGAEGTASKRVGGRHFLTAGLEFRRNIRQDQTNFDLEPFASYVDARYRSNQAAIYAQDEIALHRRLTATVGARYDWWSLTGGTATPRVGLVYRTDANTAVKALYGEAYRAPSVYELYYYPDPLGPTLRPERLRTSEVVFEQYLGGSLRLTATGYLTHARNLIAQTDAPDLFYFVNRARTASRGFELEAERRWASGVLVRGSYAGQRTTDRETDTEISNSPRHLGLVHVAAPFASRRVSVAAESQYLGSRRSTLGSDMPGVWLTNANVTFEPPRQPLSLAFRVANLWNTSYAHPVGLEFRQDTVPQDGRTLSLRATLRF